MFYKNMATGFSFETSDFLWWGLQDISKLLVQLN